jgi:hypothetical protein
VISVGLLRVRGSQLLSDFRIGWSPDEQGQPRTEEEKIRILEQLAVGGLPGSHATFSQLMSSAYGFDRSSTPESEEELRKKLVETILRAVLNSRRGISSEQA